MMIDISYHNYIYIYIIDDLSIPMFQYGAILLNICHQPLAARWDLLGCIDQPGDATGLAAIRQGLCSEGGCNWGRVQSGFTGLAHGHTRRDQMHNLDDGIGWHRYVLCIFDALVQTWTSLDELQWSCHKVTSLGNSPKPPVSVHRMVNLSNSARFQIYTWIMLNWVISAQGITNVDLFFQLETWVHGGHDTSGGIFFMPGRQSCSRRGAVWLDWWSLKNSPEITINYDSMTLHMIVLFRMWFSNMFMFWRCSESCSYFAS